MSQSFKLSLNSVFVNTIVGDREALEAIYPADAGYSLERVWLYGEFSAAVNLERDRRIEAGRAFALAGGVSVRVSGDATTKENLQGFAFGAQLRIAQGDIETLVDWRDADNVVHSLTPPQVLELWQKGAAYMSAVFKAAWTMKDAGAIPENFTDDQYWPAREG